MTSDSNKRWADPTGRFDWHKPLALQWHEWDEWREDMQSNYPVRYFFYESLPDFWDDIWKYGIHRFFSRLKAKIYHRFHPRHRYHVVRTRLKPGYYDPDIRMFEAVFALLCEFVENNKAWDVVDWDFDLPHATAWKEMMELVHWYKEIYPNREKEFEKQRPEPRISMDRFMNDKYREDLDVVAYRKYLDDLMKEEERWREEDEEMLVRAIKLRPFLWYA